MRSLISPPHRNVGTYNTTKINQLMAWNLYKAHWGLNHCQMGCVFPKSGWTCLKKMEKSPKKNTQNIHSKNWSAMFFLSNLGVPGDSKWPFDPRSLEVTNNLWKGHIFTIPKRSQRIARYIFFQKYFPLSCLIFLDFQNKTCHLGRCFCFTPFFLHFLTPRDESLGQAHHGNSLNFREMNDWNLQPSPVKRKANDLNQTSRIH